MGPRTSEPYALLEEQRRDLEVVERELFKDVARLLLFEARREVFCASEPVHEHLIFSSCLWGH